MIKIIPPNQFKKLPWKNGKGFTTELAISPKGTVDKFDWRISIATVTEDGAFSNFAGILRNLVLIEGNGLKLEHSQTGKESTSDYLEQLLDFATFDGGSLTVSTLYDGAIKDLNIMADINKYQVEVQTYQENQRVSIPEADLCFAYSLQDGLEILDEKRDSQTVVKGSLLQITSPPANQYVIQGRQLIIASFKKIC